MARILLVEDHDLVHRYLCDAILAAGHQAACVKTKDEAERELATGKFDLVVCDVRLPDGSGHDLAVRAAGLGIKAVVITGHPETAHDLASAGIAHLSKPFRIIAFMKLLEESLAKP
jgi:DNA-binding NtrC family response regulator